MLVHCELLYGNHRNVSSALVHSVFRLHLQIQIQSGYLEPHKQLGVIHTPKAKANVNVEAIATDDVTTKRSLVARSHLWGYFRLFAQSLGKGGRDLRTILFNSMNVG